jgi:hypothetical protein
MRPKELKDQVTKDMERMFAQRLSKMIHDTADTCHRAGISGGEVVVMVLLKYVAGLMHPAMDKQHFMDLMACAYEAEEQSKCSS